jgi:hypothetical protein
VALHLIEVEGTRLLVLQTKDGGSVLWSREAEERPFEAELKAGVQTLAEQVVTEPEDDSLASHLAAQAYTSTGAPLRVETASPRKPISSPSAPITAARRRPEAKTGPGRAAGNGRAFEERAAENKAHSIMRLRELEMQRERQRRYRERKRESLRTMGAFSAGYAR